MVAELCYSTSERAGARERFFSWGGKHVDMPSDCQNLGGAQAYSFPSDKKLGGQLPPLPPPPAPAPLGGREGGREGGNVLCPINI